MVDPTAALAEWWRALPTNKKTNGERDRTGMDTAVSADDAARLAPADGKAQRT